MGTQLKLAGKRLRDYTSARDRLKADREAGEIIAEEREALRLVAADLREELQDADFEMKRRVLDILEVEVKLGRDGDQRCLEATCGITLKPDILTIGNPSLG